MSQLLDTLVVVADGKSARLFSAESDLGELHELKKIANKNHASDHRGGAHEGGHHAEEKEFARDVSHAIDAALAGIRDIVLVAPPRLLGDLRGALSHGAEQKVRKTLHRDLVAEEVHALAKHLRKLLDDQHLESAHH